MKRPKKTQKNKRQVFTSLAYLAVGLTGMIALALVVSQPKEAPTGYAVSNIFMGSTDTTSTLGFIARDAQETKSPDYDVKSVVLLPSGEFTEGDYTVIIPYLETDVAETLPPPLLPPGDGRREEGEEVGGKSCEGSWQCSGWGECQPSNLQYRVCVIVSCEYTSKIIIPPKPSEVKGCGYSKPEEPKQEEQPSPKPAPEEKFEFYVKPSTEKKYIPGDDVNLHTHINNVGSDLENLEIEYNIDDGTERTVYVEYAGIFDVQAKSKYDEYMDHSLDGYSKKDYKIHATLYSNGKKLAESYHDLDLS